MKLFNFWTIGVKVNWFCVCCYHPNAANDAKVFYWFFIITSRTSIYLFVDCISPLPLA